jgi:hypothetical protein
MVSKKEEKLLQEAIEKLNSGREIDLAANGMSKAVAKRLLDDIDEYCVKTYDDGHRKHLGASLIGHECSRYLWGIFRWLKREPTTGQKQRLFNRGHREEARFIEWLEGVGCQVWFETPEGKQYRISDVGGHFGGSLDGICILPERYGIKEPILLEFKTNGTGPKFDNLQKKGMPLAKPQHFAQTSTYGFKGVEGTQFRYCLYLNINKNDDHIHCEIVKLNWQLGEQMIQKAERIITSQEPPARLSDNPTFQQCTWCSQFDICHKGAAPEVNCRSCKFAVPKEMGKWACNLHEAFIPEEFIKDACPQYKAITDL